MFHVRRRIVQVVVLVQGAICQWLALVHMIGVRDVKVIVRICAVVAAVRVVVVKGIVDIVGIVNRAQLGKAHRCLVRMQRWALIVHWRWIERVVVVVVVIAHCGLVTWHATARVDIFTDIVCFKALLAQLVAQLF